MANMLDSKIYDNIMAGGNTNSFINKLSGNAAAVQAPQSVQAPQATYGTSAPTNNGLTGVRQTFVSNGFNTADIGFNQNNNYLTYKGNDIGKLNNITDGVSYDSMDNIQSMMMKASQYDNDPYVFARSYTNSSGNPISVDWDKATGMVMVGGNALKPAFVTADGRAVVRTSDIEAAMAKANAASGYQNPQSIVKNQAAKYDPIYDDLLNRIQNPEDIRDDLRWKSYEDMYLREGNRAMENTMAGMAGMTGGFVNSAALTAGAQQRNYYNSQLMDKYPELQQMIFDQNRAALSDTMGVDNHQFNREYGANTDIYNRVNEQNALRTEQERYNYDRARQEKYDAYDLAMLGNSLSRDNVDTAGYQKMYDANYELVMQKVRAGEMSETEAKMLLDALPGQLERQAESERLANAGALLSNQYTQNQIANYGKSSGGNNVTKEQLKADTLALARDWLYSPVNTDGSSYFYPEWNADTDTTGAARDKLNDARARNFIINELIAAGYTNAQAQAEVNKMIKEYEASANPKK